MIVLPAQTILISQMEYADDSIAGVILIHNIEINCYCAMKTSMQALATEGN